MMESLSLSASSLSSLSSSSPSCSSDLPVTSPTSVPTSPSTVEMLVQQPTVNSASSERLPGSMPLSTPTSPSPSFSASASPPASPSPRRSSRRKSAPGNGGSRLSASSSHADSGEDDATTSASNTSASRRSTDTNKFSRFSADGSTDGDVRRSHRDPALAYLDRSDVRNLLAKINENHEDTVVLKLKNHLHADINHLVLDAILAALLTKNRVCQALYAQNLLKAMGDPQLDAMTKLCTKKKIWCVNVGENYNISKGGWDRFCATLPTTFITHLYVSEHTITGELKNRMRDYIRTNRKKHDLHCSMKNIAVIERCTNMWW
jgi:hypothetical protein